MIPNEIGLPRNGAPGMTSVLDEPSSASAATCEPLLTRGRGPSKQGFWPQRRKREMTPTRDTTHPNEAAFPAGLSGPALCALAHAGIGSMAQLARAFGGRIARATRDGTKALRILRSALAQQGVIFARASDLSDAPGRAFHRVPTYRPVRRFSSRVQPVSSSW
jgi:hypothetical protein